MRTAEKLVRKIRKAFGLSKAKKAILPPSPLIHHKIELLFDVGANRGQYARLVRRQGYAGKIVSFEPLPDAYEKLLQHSRNDTLWTVHERCAVGSTPGHAEINVSRNSLSSSLLPMLPAHLSAAANSLYVGKADTRIITLDSVFDAYRTDNERTFLKMDTQGYETEVLKGLTNNLSNVLGVQIELSIVPLYEHQDLYRHFLEFFKENGFLLWSLIPGFVDARTGQLLQFDAVFVRNA